jgi:Fic/DOC family N-terminal
MPALMPLEQLNPARFEAPAILKKLASSSRKLAELKGIAASIPNQGILINTLALQEAKVRSGRELRSAGSRGRSGNEHRSESATRVRYVCERLIAACCLRADVVVGQRLSESARGAGLAWRRARQFLDRFTDVPLGANPGREYRVPGRRRCHARDHRPVDRALVPGALPYLILIDRARPSKLPLFTQFRSNGPLV